MKQYLVLTSKLIRTIEFRASVSSYHPIPFWKCTYHEISIGTGRYQLPNWYRLLVHRASWTCSWSSITW